MTWCRQLLSTAGAFRDSPHLSAEQRRRATLLAGTYPCVRYDATLALSLLPPAIAFLLKAAPVEPSLLAPTSHALAAYVPPRRDAAPPSNAMPRSAISRAELVNNLILEIDSVLRATATAAEPTAASAAAAAAAARHEGAGASTSHDATPAEAAALRPADGDGDGGYTAERLLCCQALFDVFDSLSEWLGQHRR